ncbi:hypothetical protein KBD18_01620, partial [Patescibacteria group bacterium]|nr:hypothetical protein [Patescibacteria group bacterium]
MWVPNLQKWCTDSRVRVAAWYTSEQRADFFVILGLLGFALIVFAPALFFGDLFLNRHNFADFYPRFAWAHAMLVERHQLPFWSSQFAFGFPMYLDAYGLMHPIVLLALRLFSALTAYHLLVVCGFFLGSTLMYACARSLCLSRCASLFAALAYTYAAQQLYWGQELAWAASIALYPLAVLFADVTVRRGWQFLLFAALAVGAFFPVAYIEMVLYALLVGGARAVFHDVWGTTRSTRFRTTRRYLFMSLLAVVIASPWLVPATAFVQESSRAGGNFQASFETPGYMQPGEIIRVFFPAITFPLSPFPWADFFDGTRLFLGILPLPLALIACLRKPHHSHFWFFFGIAVFGFAVSLSFLPLYRILHALPILHLFRSAWKWLFVHLFAMALLAGYGFDALADVAWLRHRLWNWLRWIAGTLVVGALLVWGVAAVFRDRFLVLAFQYFDAHQYQAMLGRPLDHYHDVIRTAYDGLVRMIQPWRPGMLAGLIPLLFLVVYPSLASRLSRKQIQQSFLGAIALSLLGAAYGIVLYAPRTLFSAASPVVPFLQSQQDGARMVSFFPYMSDYQTTFGLPFTDMETNMTIHKNNLNVNWPLAYGLESSIPSGNFMSARPKRMTYALQANGARNGEEYLAHLTVLPEE